MRVKQLFFLVMAGLFLFAGCNNLADKRNQTAQLEISDEANPIENTSDSEIAYLQITDARIDSSARTVKPEFTLESIADFAFVLNGIKADDTTATEVNLASFDDYEELISNSIPIDKGQWHLTLTASAAGTILKATNYNVEIESGDNTLEFTLRWDDDALTGNGTFDFRFNFVNASNRDDIAAVTGEIVNYNPSTREETPLDVNTYGEHSGEYVLGYYSSWYDERYWYSYSNFESDWDLPAGTYRVIIRFYADSERRAIVNTWRETLIISGGQTSRGERSISSLNPVYSIHYFDGDYDISYDWQYQNKYTRLCPDITLPTLSKGGYAFLGWYTSPDFKGEKVTTIPKGSMGDKYYYAKWEDAVIITIEQSDLELTYDKQAGIIIFTANGGSGNYVWSVDNEVKQDSVSLEYRFAPTVTGTYEIEVTNGMYSATAFVQVNKIAFVDNFVSVTGGTFTFDENNAVTPESSVFISGRTVTIPNLYVCKHEVTQSEYEKYCMYGGDEPNNNHGAGEYFPAYSVSWYDAIVYCNLRSMAENYTPVYSINGETDPAKWTDIVTSTAESGGTKYCGPSASNTDWNAVSFDTSASGYRLPTEAEWEYIARGGNNWDSFTYSGSNNIDDVAWYSTDKTHEVALKAANTLGIYDMTGNVWEWCWDWYGDIDVNTEEAGNQTGEVRVIHGGSWLESGQPITDRDDDAPYDDLPYNRFTYVGFRVVRNAD